MFRSPKSAIVDAIERFGSALAIAPERVRLSVPGGSVDLPSIRLGDTRAIFLISDNGGHQESLHSHLKTAIHRDLADDTSLDVLVVCAGEMSPSRRIVIDRGVSLVSMHAGIVRMLGLPSGWEETQRSLLARTLESVSVNGRPELATLYATDDLDHRTSAQELLSSLVGTWEAAEEPVCYIRAEAGKGKSTLLAFAAIEQLATADGPLPFFVPLRTLQRGRGVSWSELCATAGIVGPAQDTVAAGVRAGLVSLLLDGLDEVAGRYDQTIVKQVVDSIISTATFGSNSHIVISGRTTESTLLPVGGVMVRGIELPEGGEPAFSDYARSVVADITPRWPTLARRVPEPPVESTTLQSSPPSAQEQGVIVEWLQLLFDDLGKDRSLFFVQSLACLGRTRQLDGNKPLLIHRKPHGLFISAPPLYDVSILAAALACIREQDKIEDLAKHVFSPAMQLELMMSYALMASGQSSMASALPTPNEVARDVFRLDPVNQNEEFTAVLRQMQKHALLLASPGAGLTAAEWRPQFLSDWVRCAFLARAWLHRGNLERAIGYDTLCGVLACAERARITFGTLLPELFREGRLDDIGPIIEMLEKQIRNESPEASGNYWALVAGLSDTDIPPLGSGTRSLVPFADLSGMVFEGIEFTSSFSGTLAFLVQMEATNCEFVSCSFQQCDFSHATFRGCRFRDVKFDYCDGPLIFEDCSFRDCRLSQLRGRSLPAVTFDSCRFESGNKLHQDEPIGEGLFGPIAAFADCTYAESIGDLCSGAYIGVLKIPPPGLQPAAEARVVPPQDICLRALLKPFFPRRAGEAAELQARGYIRTSAIGRGLLPKGVPDTSELIGVLYAHGFTAGGRQGHIYAPWSSVAGGGIGATMLRNELLAFLVRGAKGPTVRMMLSRLEEAWN